MTDRGANQNWRLQRGEPQQYILAKDPGHIAVDPGYESGVIHGAAIQPLQNPKPPDVVALWVLGL